MDLSSLTTKPCIYMILNILNNKFYIGSAFNLKKRISMHLSYLRRNVHHNKFLQNAYNKYKEENFKIIILASVLDKSKILEIEQLFLDDLKPYKRENRI